MSALGQLWRRFWARAVHETEPRANAVTRSEGPACAACRHFRDDPADIEAALPGLSSLSSGYGSVRGRDGLCLKHDRFVTARSCCRLFEERAASE